jgi:hypothetical protein
LKIFFFFFFKTSYVNETGLKEMSLPSQLVFPALSIVISERPGNTDSIDVYEEGKHRNKVIIPNERNPEKFG